jgi:hypothetical protein
MSDDEFALFENRCIQSGLSQTDFIVSALKNSTVNIYSVEDTLRPLIHEIRKIGTNLNQLAYFSNIGQDEKVRAEIYAIRRDNEAVMEQLLEFLKNPKFTVKGKA